MKISILFTEGARQIIMTGESDHEKKALKMILPEDEIKVVSKVGSFGTGVEHINYQIGKCQGGWYKPFPEEESVMFIIEAPTPKK